MTLGAWWDTGSFMVLSAPCAPTTQAGYLEEHRVQDSHSQDAPRESRPRSRRIQAAAEQNRTSRGRTRSLRDTFAYHVTGVTRASRSNNPR